jgi:hypothetical protein
LEEIVGVAETGQYRKEGTVKRIVREERCSRRDREREAACNEQDCQESVQGAVNKIVRKAVCNKQR